MSKRIFVKSCENCRWCGCKDYGKKINACNKYIKELTAEE